MEKELLAGLISGLVVTFIVLIVGRLWSSIVEPWFEERVYKDLHIEGKWYSLYVDSSDLRQETINLKRHGHTVTGKMMCTTGPDDGEEYDLQGSFRNMLLPLSYESSDKKKTDRGTITLRSSFNGERLVGKIALYETRFDDIETGQVVWFRDKEDVRAQIEYITEHREKIQKMKNQEAELQKKFREFFKEFAKEYARKKAAEKDSVIEGEAKRIESDR